MRQIRLVSNQTNTEVSGIQRLYLQNVKKSEFSMKFSKIMLALVLSMISCSFFAMPTHLWSDELKEFKKEYVFAVIPQGPPETMYRNWKPFIDRLSHDTHLALKLKLYERMEDFDEDLREGEVDFAYLNPIQEIKAWHASGYIPLVRNKEIIRGVIFVKKNSGIKNLQDLNGKEIALVGSGNVCSIALRHDIQALDIKSHYVGSSSNVYKNVEIDESSAGGTLDVVFEKDIPTLAQEFRTIYTTDSLSSHPIAAHPSVSLNDRFLVQENVMKYAKDKNSQDLLKAIGMQDPVMANYQKDYQPLEARLVKSSETAH